MGTPRMSERLRLGESSATRSTEGVYMIEGNVPLYQARMGGSTGRSSSRSFGDPWVGRWDSISGRGPGQWTRENGGLRRAVVPVIYGPDARLSGSHSGVFGGGFSVRGGAPKVTRDDREIRSELSISHVWAIEGEGFWERTESKAVQGCFPSQGCRRSCSCQPGGRGDPRAYFSFA